MPQANDGSTPVQVTVRKYMPGISDPVVNQARAAKKQARETREANRPTGTEIRQTAAAVWGSSSGGSSGSWPSRPRYAGKVVSKQVYRWQAGSSWSRIAAIQVPYAPGWGRALLHVSAQGVAVSSRGQALRLRISVDGVAAALGVAAYAGPDLVSGSLTGGVPALDLSGERLIAMGVDVEAAQGASVTLEACCPDDSAYRGPDNRVVLSMRVDYKEV
ncbi:hypothetical protein [Bifidobacterium sp. B4142]|uniref:hypothetical protein n=1 Tax=Bifidobacterium sp. B4142 TaxID=2817962 RepID=UPI00226B1837|nr:hypothetical protein [Bifidobacterium sp. B4142]MCX8687044.1 hypothetical protein [Bifidobacterium sp. B4142]